MVWSVYIYILIYKANKNIDLLMEIFEQDLVKINKWIQYKNQK